MLSLGSPPEHSKLQARQRQQWTTVVRVTLRGGLEPVQLMAPVGAVSALRTRQNNPNQPVRRRGWGSTGIPVSRKPGRSGMKTDRYPTAVRRVLRCCPVPEMHRPSEAPLLPRSGRASSSTNSCGAEALPCHRIGQRGFRNLPTGQGGGTIGEGGLWT